MHASLCKGVSMVVLLVSCCITSLAYPLCVSSIFKILFNVNISIEFEYIDDISAVTDCNHCIVQLDLPAIIYLLFQTHF